MLIFADVNTPQFHNIVDISGSWSRLFHNAGIMESAAGAFPTLVTWPTRSSQVADTG